MTLGKKIMGNHALEQEIRGLKKEISDLKFELNRFTERSYRELIKIQSRGFFALLSEHLAEDADGNLRQTMLTDCKLFEKCRENFSNRLRSFPDKCRTHGVEAAFTDKRREFTELKNKSARLDKCETCFNGVFSTLNKQAKAMRSMNIYGRNSAKRDTLVADIPLEAVSKILKTTSNPARLLILKSLYLGSRSFTSLSEITGLRSGNLLFHLKNLLMSGLIMQEQKRGDYMITEKGSRIVDSIIRIFRVYSE